MPDLNSGWIVYEHIFPDGKSYIGITGRKVGQRWQGSKGYINQPKIYSAIQLFGWQNVEHKILAEGLTQAEACAVERAFINDRDSVKNGYNTDLGGKPTRADSFLNSEISCRLERQALDPALAGAEELAHLIRKARNDQNLASFWNDANTAIKDKYGELGNGIDDEIRWWGYLMEYCNLHIELHKDEQVATIINKETERDFVRQIVYEVLQEIEDERNRELYEKSKKQREELHKSLVEAGWFSS